MTLLDTAAGTDWSGPLGLSAATIAAALGLPTPTPAQQEVIEAPPSPALVVAGAGSGKTETMAGRVVWLVANGHVRRDEVLGLTFTRKAAGELAERIMTRLHRIDAFGRRGLLPHLEEIVATGVLAQTPADELPVLLDRLARRYGTGWDTARGLVSGEELLRPRVATYNAFADAIVREHAARIGRDAEASLLSQSGSWLLARSVVIRSADPRLADRDNALSTMIDAVQKLAGDALDNRADLDEVAAYGSAFADRLEPYIKTDVTPANTENAWAAGRGLPIIAGLAQDYALAKRAQGVLDFADQVSGALEIIETSPQIAAELRDQYRVVLLDEYQDTSVLQTRLLSSIFHDHAVMAVGDPHQSIYGWRGASADNLDAFGSAFSQEVAHRTYELMISWRNDVSILASANALLGPLRGPGRLEVGELQPRPGAGDGVVDHVWAETIDDEAEAVAEWFERVRAEHTEGNGGGEHTGAILFRAKKHMQLFADALDKRGIPHRILGLGGLLSTPEVTDVVAALRVVHDPAAGSSLIRLLVGPRFAIGVADMAALHALASTLSRRGADGRRFSEEMLARLRGSAGADEQLSIVDALDVLRSLRADHPLLSDFTDTGRERLREAGDMFDRLRRSSGQSAPELIRLIEAELRLDIELAANESRGPARVASTQLRAFGDEVRAFLDADERGTIGSLLAWLAHAEDTDELMPRPEPPQPGVVQLLTIHGAKGLEWDAAAVVRLVEDELPKSPRTTMGWLSLGTLPFDFRGDRDALPELVIPTSEGVTRTHINKAIDEFKKANKAYQEEEERRLAYVAVTRARSRLLLTGAAWGGQTRARVPSRYLQTMLEAIGAEELPTERAEGENPVQHGGRTIAWPLDALGGRRVAVEEAAALVAATAPAEPSPELARLLRERELRAQIPIAPAPTRIPASMFKDYVTGFRRTTDALVRPLPERPYPQTRIGTDFHAWIEHLYEMVGSGTSLDDALWESDSEYAGDGSFGDAVGDQLSDGDPSATGAVAGGRDSATIHGAGGESNAEAEHDSELARHQQNFLRSEWAGLRPLEVESEVNYVMRTPAGGEHIMICKLDAVFRREDRGGRIEIVDWKTGRPPATPRERQERLLQLAHYRVAYHHARGIALEDIDVALFYVGHDLVLRPEQVYTEEELAVLWDEASAAAADGIAAVTT
ncbi:UvrD-helicase domain-containing protein [Microbacterium sp. ZW T5_56]|uniref:UvrD-helicase domain-containing protein n=1 Tax=Microbacterium sp. ZW T5_56 TaxID=3378081 RepID=UPI003854BEDC